MFLSLVCLSAYGLQANQGEKHTACSEKEMTHLIEHSHVMIQSLRRLAAFTFINS